MSGLVALHSNRSDAGQALARAAATMPHRGKLTLVQVPGALLGVLAHPDRASGTPGADIHRDGDDVVVTSGPVDEVDGRYQANPAAAVLQELRRRPPEEVAARMRGAYAVVAVIDGQLVAWRDHVGFGPLFWSAQADEVAVASEAGAALVALGKPLQADLSVVEAIFFSQIDDDLGACLTGGRRLAKASWLRVSPGEPAGVHAARYWTPDPFVETRPAGAAWLSEQFEAVFGRAVHRVLRGRDVVGLSGGVDSPAVAAFAAPGYCERYGQPLAALSTVYPHLPSVDETPWIELVAERLGLDLTTFQPRSSRLDQVSRYARLLQAPVSRMMTSDLEEFYSRVSAGGHDTLLTGEYAEYLVEMRDGVVRHLVRHGRVAGAVRFLAAKRRGGARAKTIARELGVAVLPSWVLDARRRRQPSRSVPAFVDRTRLGSCGRAGASGSRRWRESQVRAFYGPGISVEADEVFQQACGVDCRRPWIDVDLWEFFLSLRAEVKFPGSRYKALLKSLLRGRVPDEILDRTTFTTFNDSLMDGIDYPTLRSWLVQPQWRMSGVDYDVIADLLQREALTLTDYIWVSELVGAHAFVAEYP